LEDSKIRLSTRKVQKDKEKEAIREANKSSDDPFFNQTLREQIKS